MNEYFRRIFEGRRILVAVAHHDDTEFMFGGTLARLAKYQEQWNSAVVTATFGSRQENTGEPLDEAVEQQQRALDVLGIRSLHDANFGFRARFLPKFDDEIRLGLNELKRRFEPDLVMTHYRGDRNQDHVAVHEQVMRVFPDCTVFGGEVSNTGDRLRPSLFVGLEHEHMAAKYRALECYIAEAHKSYFRLPLIEALARVRGAHSARFEYAEAIEVYRLHA